MSMYTHTVTLGENPWKFVKEQLSANGEVSNQDIATNLKYLAKENGCDSVEEFQHKYFSGVGKTFSYESLDSSKSESSVMPAIDTSLATRRDCVFDRIRPTDSIYERMVDTTRSSERIDTLQPDTTSVPVSRDSVKTTDTTHLCDTIGFVTIFKSLVKEDWSGLKQAQDRINGLSSNKDRVIAYNREMNESRQNYIIVDKQNYTATVYSWDGQPIKEFEVGVAKNKSDALLRRSKKNKENNFASTTAGIYTINYRANGKDPYKHLYNDRVFTLSNDGLAAKGVKVKDKNGDETISYSGETGVALHQIPNGNTYRRHLIDKEGVSDENNRFSSGCVNFRPEDFDELAECIDGVGTKVYILPEDENNYMTVKNGQLHFAQKEYTGDVATTTTKNDPVRKICIENKEKQSGFSKAIWGGESDIMMQTLADKKFELIKDFGIDNDTYNELAMLTLGIAEQESEFGSRKAGKYHVKEGAQWLVNTWKGVKRLFGAKESHVNSRGLTQIKLGCYKDADTIALMKKYGINEDNLCEGDKAAIATMIALACMYKNELPAMKKKMEEQNISTADALLYCWQGKKGHITNGTATPDQNIYIQNVRKYMDNFTLKQSV